ncbi:MAG: ABC transporter ATP-binding protein [Verrucomicrobiales bacterium]
MTLIKIRELEFCYPGSTFKLRVGSLDIASGEQVALIGASGCGKTTLAHLIAGIHRPSAGQIQVAEHALHEMGDRARRNFRISQVGFIFQDFALLDYLNIEENILLPYFVNSSLPLDRTARDTARELAGKLGIGDKLKRHPEQLSGGEKQRVAICRALAARPSLIIADEPTGNLDRDNALAVTDLICSLAEQHQATLLMVTHELAVLEKFDRSLDIGKEFGS